MSGSMFDAFLSTGAMGRVFGDAALVQAMLRFEAALAQAQAAQGMLPERAAGAIAACCKAELFDLDALVEDARPAGTLAIPLVKQLTALVHGADPDAARYVHQGATSQDVIDTAMALVSQEALALLDDSVARLCGHLLELAERHLDTPMLARTLMQPAQVISFGLKVIGWAAPLLRARARLRQAGREALRLQLGGAVGTLASMAPHGEAVQARMAQQLELAGGAARHTQRDDWVRLGMELAVLCGSMGKIGADLALMAQAEVAELAEPRAAGRGGSSAMPHKNNPVAAMTARACALRAPQRAAALLAAMGQEHERGLGNWQAELAEWPGLFLSAHGAAAALADAFAGLQVMQERMRANIDALHGQVFTEDVARLLADTVGRSEAQALVRQASAAPGALIDTVAALLAADARFAGIDRARLAPLFDPARAAAPAAALARTQLELLKEQFIEQSREQK